VSENFKEQLEGTVFVGSEESNEESFLMGASAFLSFRAVRAFKEPELRLHSFTRH
jgi:hypothetical protein